MVRYGNVEDIEEGIREAVSAALEPEEEFLGGIRAADAVRSKRRTRLILTDRRLIAVKPTRQGLKLTDIDRTDLSYVDYESDALNRELTIGNESGLNESWKLQSDGADAFAAALESTEPYSVFVGPENQPVISERMGGERDRTDDQPDQVRRPTTVEAPSVSATSERADRSDEYPEASVTTLASRLQGMDNYEFEQFVGSLWERLGWNTEVSQASVDAGIDVIATQETPYPQKKVIQAKRYSENTTVGGPDIQQYASLKNQVDGADSVVVVTTSSFTSSAKDRANELNVKLVDGTTLATMIDDLDAYDLVDTYLGHPEVATSRSESNNEEFARVSVEDPIQEAADHAPKEATVPSSGRPSGDKKANPDLNGGNIPSAERIAADEPRATADVGNWHYGIIAGTVLALGASALGINSLYGVLVLTLPLLVYVDSYKVSKASLDWHPRRWLYAIASLIFFIGPPVYLYKRWRNVGL